MMTSGEHVFTPQRLWRVYHVPLVLGCVGLLFLIFSITIIIKSYQRTTPITFSSDEASVAGVVASIPIRVDIEGAVVNPGVYDLPQSSRVDDGIEAAGGFRNDADVEAVSRSINRAAKLSDGAKLYIPRVGEEPEDAPASVAGGININTASQSDLEALSGIGPVTAGKIIASRPFTRLEELVEKKAMSQSLFEKLKGQLTL